DLEAAEELPGGGGGRGVGHRPQGCSCLIGPQRLDIAEVASPGEHALGHRDDERTRAEPTAPGLQVPKAGIDPLDEPDAGNQLPHQGQAGMSGEGRVIVARVQLWARRGSIHLQGASCLWDCWLLSDYHHPSSGGTFFVFQVRKSCCLTSFTRGSKSDTSGHGGPCPCDLPPLAHPSLTELGQQNEPPLTEEVGDPPGNPVEVEAQFEYSLSERPRVRHADGRALLGQSIDVESGGGEGSNKANDSAIRPS